MKRTRKIVSKSNRTLPRENETYLGPGCLILIGGLITAQYIALFDSTETGNRLFGEIFALLMLSIPLMIGFTWFFLRRRKYKKKRLNAENDS